ncbi:uncharacterized protein LOC109616594 [Esox lucius]|uniref:uncharacterized protein LOC109616594 n=1 Tax=Esox lucius TaxID=8010 RepID=UPI001477367A|nr:uncharacterized protein LOC109616594 [Esox lucius]
MTMVTNVLNGRVTPKAMGERLQAVSNGLWVTMGCEVAIVPPQVPLSSPVTASQRAAALSCLKELVRMYRCSIGQGTAHGVCEWKISTAVEMTLRNASMFPNSIFHNSWMKVSNSDQLPPLTLGESTMLEQTVPPLASLFPKEAAMMSAKPNRAQQLRKKSLYHKQRNASSTLCMVPEMLLIHTIGRFIYNIYPLEDFSPWTEEVIENRVEVTRQLSFLVQEALAKSTKTKALQRELRKLSEPNQNCGPLELQLGDLLFTNFLKQFSSQRPLSPEAFLDNHQLCLEVSLMVSRVLLQHWTPRISFSPVCEVQEISPRLKRCQGGVIQHWSSTDNLLVLADEGDEDLHFVGTFSRMHRCPLEWSNPRHLLFQRYLLHPIR